MKKMIIGLVIALVVFGSLPLISALTASIGNSRMVLRVNVGDSVEKSILVKNVNEIPVTIEMTSSGDLADNLVLDEETFVLQPGQEKKAGFRIDAEEAGTTETKINVKFTPEKGNSAGLSSTIIVIASENDEDEESDDFIDNFLDDDVEELNDENTSVSISSGNETVNLKGKKSGIKKENEIMLLFISSVILICALIALYFYSLHKRQGKIAKPKKNVTKSNA